MGEARAGGNKRDGNGSNSEQRLLEYFLSQMRENLEISITKFTFPQIL